MIKHKVAITVSAIAIGLSVGLALSYHDHKKAEDNAAAQKSQQIAKQQSAHDETITQTKIDVAVKKAVKQQCQSDQQAYNSLPKTVQAKVPAPVCNIQ